MRPFLFISLAAMAAYGQDNVPQEKPKSAPKIETITSFTPLPETEYKVIVNRENQRPTGGEQNYDVAYSLELKEPAVTVFLYRDSKANLDYMEFSSVQVFWLVPRQLSLVTWIRGPQNASGHRTEKFCAIFQISERKSRKIFQNSGTLFYKSGLSYNEEEDLTFEVAIFPTGSVTITRIGKRAVYSALPAPEGSLYVSKIQYYTIRERTPLVLEDDFIREGIPDAVLELSDEYMPGLTLTLNDAADFLVLLLAPRYGNEIETIFPEERGRMINELQNCNHGIEAWSHFFRTIDIPGRKKILDYDAW